MDQAVSFHVGFYDPLFSHLSDNSCNRLTSPPSWQILTPISMTFACICSTWNNSWWPSLKWDQNVICRATCKRYFTIIKKCWYSTIYPNASTLHIKPTFTFPPPQVLPGSAPLSWSWCSTIHYISHCSYAQPLSTLPQCGTLDWLRNCPTAWRESNTCVFWLFTQSPATARW